MFLVLSDLFYKFECGSPNTISNKMKVNPNNHQFRWKTGFLHAFLTIFLMVTVACDFDIPEKFEMPTWYLDLKIPLVQTRYQMADISDSSAGIFLTDDSLGFKIIQEGEMPATELPDLPSVPLGLDEALASPETDEITVDGVSLPDIDISFKINIVYYDTLLYLDTAITLIPVLDDDGNTIIIYDDYGIPIGIEMDTLVVSIEGVDYMGTPFSFPTDSVRHMTASSYNTFIVTVFDSAMGLISPFLNTSESIPLDSMADEAGDIIRSIDTLIIAYSEDNSVLKTNFRNNNISTNIENVFSHIITSSEELDGPYYEYFDTLANHNAKPILPRDSVYVDVTNLSGKGLLKNFMMSTNFSLAEAHPDSIVKIHPGSLYVDFGLTFQLAGIDSIDVTTNNYSMTDSIDMPPMELPEMDMSADGISKMEIYRNVLKNEDAAYNENKLIISNLANTFPFDMNFLMNFQNFSPTPGGDSVKIDTVLRKGVEINKTFDLRGYTLQSTDGDNDNDGWPDSAFTSFDLVLDIAIPEQKASIPLDGSPLGEFTMNMKSGPVIVFVYWSKPLHGNACGTH